MSNDFAKWLAVPVAVVALVGAGCGSDDSGKSDSTSSSGAQPTAKEPVKPAPAPAAGDQNEIKQAILAWEFEADCDAITSKYLHKEADIEGSDKELCDFEKKTFQKPGYPKSQITFPKIAVSGDKAVVKIGSPASSLTSEYDMVKQGGRWKIDDFKG
jgi:hypothetical protein